MKDVKHALIISEYYPKVFPPDVSAHPVTRNRSEHGLTISYAEVSGSGVTVVATDGQSISKLAGANVSLH